MTEILHNILIFLLFFGLFSVIFGLAGCNGEPPLCQAATVAAIEIEIVGGEPSRDRRSTVRVITQGGSCTGVVIGPRTVITAAHCEGPLFILIDTFTRVLIESVEAHALADIQVAYTDQILPEPYAAIPTYEELECTSLIAQGYGLGGNGELHEREVLEVERVPGSIFTTEAACRGDSGGPLWAVDGNDEHLVGVASFTLGECAGGEERLVGYTDAVYYRDWIGERTK